jgi:S1-C subfamily serine protease
LLTALQLADVQQPIGFVSLPSRPPESGVAGGQGVRAYLGTIPEYGIATEGVQLAGVSSGSPAARAGLREGDVIIRLAEKKIQNIEDLTDALSARKAGDEVEVVVLRSGKPLTLKATLSSRG